MEEEWKRVWYHKPDSYWTKGQEGTWCHVRKEVRAYYESRWFCREYDEDRRANRNMAKPRSIPLTSYLDDAFIDWEKQYIEEENEFGPVTP